MAFFLKLSYSKVRASFTHLSRGSHLSACNVSYTFRCMFDYVYNVVFNYYSRLENMLINDGRFCISTVYIYTYELQRFE